MFVRVRRGDSTQNFTVWVYGDERLSRGSGLFVPETGVIWNHHFLLSADGTDYRFLPGDYLLELYAAIWGAERNRRLFSASLTVPEDGAELIAWNRQGLYFDWSPDTRSYHRHWRPFPTDGSIAPAKPAV